MNVAARYSSLFFADAGGVKTARKLNISVNTGELDPERTVSARKASPMGDLRGQGFALRIMIAMQPVQLPRHEDLVPLARLPAARARGRFSSLERAMFVVTFEENASSELPPLPPYCNSTTAAGAKYGRSTNRSGPSIIELAGTNADSVVTCYLATTIGSTPERHVVRFERII